MLDNVRIGLFRVFDGSSLSKAQGRVLAEVTLEISSSPGLDTAGVGSLGRCHGAPVLGCVARLNGIWK